MKKKLTGLTVVLAALLILFLSGFYSTNPGYELSRLSNTSLYFSLHNLCQNNVPQYSYDDNTYKCLDDQPGPKVKVVIVAYLRSGSSFTGDLFDKHPDVFYSYEPLKTLTKVLVGRNETAWYWNKTQGRIKAKNLEAGKDDMMGSVLNCRFFDADLHTLTDKFMKMGQKTKLFATCVRQHSGVLGILRCMPGLLTSCCSSQVVVAKTIRYPMSKALTLLHSDPGVKVIHLLRDPRGILMSQEKMGKFDASEMGERAAELCETMETNLRVGFDPGPFRDRVLQVRYEDFASDPFPFAEELLRFVGLKMTSGQRDRLLAVSFNPENRQCPKCISVLPTNSSYAAFRWRERIVEPEVKEIDAKCARVYEMAGYLPLRNLRQIRNKGVASMSKAGDISGFLSA